MSKLCRSSAKALGIAVQSEFTDSGLTATQGCPTLCSIGPVGDDGHTPEEYILISLVPCAQSLAISVMRRGVGAPHPTMM